MTPLETRKVTPTISFFRKIVCSALSTLLEQEAHVKVWTLRKEIYKEGTFLDSQFNVLPPSKVRHAGESNSTRLCSEGEDNREHVTDSGAFSSCDGPKTAHSLREETSRITDNPWIIMTAAKEESTVYINDLDISHCVMLVEDLPAVLSAGSLCEEVGYSNSWR